MQKTQDVEVKSPGTQCLEDELCAGGKEEAVLILGVAYWGKIRAIGMFCGCSNIL